jgi:tetratricopeptide (TPR) repeat protein
MGQSEFDDLELVTRWKRRMRAKRRDRAPGRFGLRLTVTLGFCFLAFAASAAGGHPRPTLGFSLFAMLFFFELPGAVLARARGRAAHIWIQSTGAHTEIHGRALPGLVRLSHALVGSGLSLAFGFVALLLASTLQSPLLAETGRLQLFWGAAQLLPLSPFKLGSLLKEQLGHWARVKQALASLGLALATVVRIIDRFEVPLIFVACSVWFFLCMRELLDSIAEARDAKLSAPSSLAEIARLTRSDEPRQALRLARALLDSAHSAALRGKASVALAWAAIGAGDVEQAREAMALVREADAHLLAAYLATSGQGRRAIALLESAEAAGARNAESLKLLADLYYRDGEREKLLALLDSAADLLSEDELLRIRQALATLRPEPTSVALELTSLGPYKHAF